MSKLINSLNIGGPISINKAWRCQLQKDLGIEKSSKNFCPIMHSTSEKRTSTEAESSREGRRRKRDSRGVLEMELGDEYKRILV